MKYITSPIDGKTYCKKNGQFMRHVLAHGYTSLAELYFDMFPANIKLCTCGKVCLFNSGTLTYKATCGNKTCANKASSICKSTRTTDQKEETLQKYRASMNNKTPEEKLNITTRRGVTATQNNSYITAKANRRATCKMLYGNETYNNSDQISATKLAWDESRVQLFKERLLLALDGKQLSDFHTHETYIKRRKTLEDNGHVTRECDLTEWQNYKQKVRRLTEREYKKHKHIINPCDLPRGLRLYEVDHIVPIFYGFNNNIPAEIIASVENLQMLHMTDNRKKSYKHDNSQ